MKPYSLVSASGQLGVGFQPESIDKAIASGAQMVGCDAGGNDSGPNALATGVPRFSREAVKRDVDAILTRAIPAKLPVVFGSAGTAGADINLAWLLDIVREVARERHLHFTLGSIHAEIPKETLLALHAEGRTRPLFPSKPLSAADIEACLHIVGMMGVEPFQEAFGLGAQVVVGGRASDTSVFAALPLLEGADPALAWHCAKILECGASAVVHKTAGDAMMATIGEDYFDVVPLRDDYRCSPQSVAAHTLYENADPFHLVEPSGMLVTDRCTYEAISDRAVRVRGSVWEPAAEYTIKLEGAKPRGYATAVLGGIRDPRILRQLDSWLAGLAQAINVRVSATMGPDVRYEVLTRVYGQNGVMGALEPTPVIDGHEVLVLWQVLADTQARAHSIATSLSHVALHYPIPEYQGSITAVSYAFTPAEIDRGALYEFNLHHVVVPDSPTSLFPIEIESV